MTMRRWHERKRYVLEKKGGVKPPLRVTGLDGA